jgi:ABC-type oligopeptide transport system ATPase subunit
VRLNVAHLLDELVSGGLQPGGDIDADGVRALLARLVEAGFGHLEVLLGYRLPHSSTRVDVVLCGARPGSGEPTYLMVDLKAWGSMRTLTGDLVLADDRAVPELRPAEQVRRYRDFLIDSATSLPAESVYGLAYLYKMEDGVKLDVTVRALFDTAADARPIADRLMRTPYRRPRTFLDAAVNEMQGRERVVLLDEQKVAFELVMQAVDRANAAVRGTVVVVLGGPGSGKSTIAMSLFSELSQSGKSVYHATGSSSLTATIRRHLGRDNRRMQTMFKYFNNFIDAEPAALDVLICDEAHRVRQSSLNRYSRRDLPQRSQLEELITAAKVPVFLLDEEQTVRPGETGTLAGITEAAERLGCGVEVVRLRGGFRTDWYIDWVDKLLGLHGEPARWAGHDGEFAVHSADSPQEMESWLIHQRDSRGGTARIAAGYCWKWSDPVSEAGTAGLVPDVQIGDWRRPWNAKPDRRVPGIPSAHFWATDERGFSQVGTIYTAQGFEYDWAGVIFGNDFVRRDDQWVARREYSHDPAVKRAAEEDFTRLIRNTYRVLLTRGVSGVCVYSVDPETQKYLRSMTV